MRWVRAVINASRRLCCSADRWSTRPAATWERGFPVARLSRIWASRRASGMPTALSRPSTALTISVVETATISQLSLRCFHTRCCHLIFVRFVSFRCLFQAFCLVGCDKGIYERLNIAIHDGGYVIDGEANTMVGDAPIGEMVGANLLRALTGSHLRASCTRTLFLLLTTLNLIETCA